MKTGERLDVYTTDGNSIGYFLDGRLYEYATSTCVGFVDEQNRFISQSQIVGRLKGSCLIKNDGTTLSLTRHH
jgi:hypothetical protein